MNPAQAAAAAFHAAQARNAALVSNPFMNPMQQAVQQAMQQAMMQQAMQQAAFLGFGMPSNIMGMNLLPAGGYAQPNMMASPATSQPPFSPGAGRLNINIPTYSAGFSNPNMATSVASNMPLQQFGQASAASNMPLQQLFGQAQVPTTMQNVNQGGNVYPPAP
jgi:hypothetical protein